MNEEMLIKATGSAVKEKTNWAGIKGNGRVK